MQVLNNLLSKPMYLRRIIHHKPVTKTIRYSGTNSENINYPAQMEVVYVKYGQEYSAWYEKGTVGYDRLVKCYPNGMSKFIPRNKNQ